MRLALKYQIILAPASVLLLMTLLLGFLQFNYWDLSVKRQEARRLATVFIALAEADLATQRMAAMAQRLRDEPAIDMHSLEEMEELFFHLQSAVERILEQEALKESKVLTLRQTVADLNPEQGFDFDRITSSISRLRPEIAQLSEAIRRGRDNLRDVHNQDMDEMVARTTFVSIIVLGTAILVGIFLSLALARRILHRIQFLSDSAGRIARGDLTPPVAPAETHDELDELAVSINRMTERLIRVVGTEKLLEGAEEERRRIAMDIHDQTLSDLSSVLRGIQAMKGRQEEAGEVTALEEDLQRAIANLREVMDNLHPQTLDILGLGAALQSHLERHLGGPELPEYHLYISPRVDSAEFSRTARLTLYRVALEAIHNVIRHAGATRYEVGLDRRDGVLVLSVEDNGRGFDPAAPLAAGHRGLNNIRERAKTIGANISWQPSRFSSGTRFELTLAVPPDPEPR
ncbi:sensor histidine kinase, PAS, GAF, PAS and PAS domain-containing [Desulfuromonas sp. DDH964]|uniref:sensor histidine kinase n=1 Tax=Desulfuromonas sp. DDH964 TaxID=1823759 RepID=UPI00078C7B69|nr:HAMP domain-containing protein [Desulfuromonas sp. DDH964]AMV73807.1 sensor histidine kinase, PAS, GAF, PAS and PAS domain-containing [Desulfuromonas sp. DDH964]